MSLTFCLEKGLQVLTRKSTLNLRPLFLSIDFKSTLESDPLMEIISEVKLLLKSGKSSLWEGVKEAMKDIVPARLKSSIKENAQYEFYIYSLLKNGLEAGDIYYSSSTRFKSFEEDLITDEELDNSQHLIKSLNLPLLEMPMAERLKSLKERLETKYIEVNEKIKRGDHELKFSTKNKTISWHLPYKKQEDNTNNFFYEKLPQISIISVLQFVNQHCGFLDSFKHIQAQYSKRVPDLSSLIACLISYGERFGHSKMANISDMKIHQLRSMGSNYLRLESTRAANDVITNATANLPIFEHFNFSVGSLHASADGQKFESKRPVFEARYSPKYFGLHKGLVNYSLIINHIPANARLIGANEHESYYAFDIVFNNTSELNPDIISVDMAGTNQVNFALLETFGRTWAPRYTNLNKKESTLLGFREINEYPEEMLIKPAKKVNEELILKEEANLKRIFASMALKKTTQSTIVRKLSSYAKRNRTKKALWELDHIYMSLYLLEYIDNPSLRRNVQRALNRGESYHQLQRAITLPNGGRFKGSSEKEIAIENDCTRLIGNAIIFFNTMMLSMLLQKAKKEGNEKLYKTITRLSPVAWRHINLYGNYEFNKAITLLDLQKIIDQINLE
jgi:TnpA family transposase